MGFIKFYKHIQNIYISNYLHSFLQERCYYYPVIGVLCLADMNMLVKEENTYLTDETVIII